MGNEGVVNCDMNKKDGDVGKIYHFRIRRNQDCE